jgi:hypothetical protein
MTARLLQSAWRFSRNELSGKPGAVQRGGVNILGDLLCSNPVAGGSSKTQKRAKLLGEPSRDRTEDPLIKSQVLCQLS